MTAAALRPHLSAALAETRVRLLIVSRYPAMLGLEILIPLLLSAMPLLLGRAVAGPDAATNFAANTGTGAYIPFLLLGSTTYILVNRAFWDLAYWMRYEQETGTLEAVSVTPTHTLTLAAGVALYSALRGVAAGALGFVIGCAAFGVNPFTGRLAVAAAFLLVGLVPLYGLSFLFAALVLRIRESARIVMVLLWGAGFLMGMFYPVHVFPGALRALALAFPPTWMVNGLRAALLDLSFFFGRWYLDLSVLWAAALLVPAASVLVFHRAERRMRANEGLGAF